jgi:hypothetical protein
MDLAVSKLHARLLEAGADRRKIERKRNATESLGRLERLSMIHERRRLQHGLKVLEGTLADLAIQERDAISKVEQHRERLESEIAQHRRRAQPVDDSEVEGLESALVTARQARDQANELVISAEQALERANLDLLTAESGPRPTPEHRRLVVEAERERWPQLHMELSALHEQVQNAAPEVVRLEQQHEQLVKELEKLGRDAEKVIIREARLIATTLAKFRLSPAVYQGPYDVVLVDEVGAATVPEVLLAVAKAKETAAGCNASLPLFAFRLRITAVASPHHLLRNL